MLSTLRISLVSVVVLVLMVSIGCSPQTNELSIDDGSEQSVLSNDDETSDPPDCEGWPFDADEALRRQEETAETFDIPVEYENEIGMEFRLIPSGEFMMGSPEDEEDLYDTVKLHCVQITKPYYLGVCEMTQGEWETVMETTLADLKDPDLGYYGEGPHNPMYRISWFDAVDFCNALSESEGKSAYYQIQNIERKGYGQEQGIGSADVTILGGSGYRLPSEAEWENACRAGCEDPYYGEVDEIAWHYGNSSLETHLVGEKLPNSFGLFDMSGNVWEWCGDWYDKDYYGVSQMTDPDGPSAGWGRVVRGGCWNSNPRGCRSADRFWNTPGYRIPVVGFRVACSVE